MSLETKQRACYELKADSMSDEGFGSIKGYGAVKNNIDSYGDLIEDGAFKSSENFVERGFMSFSHDWNEPIGTVKVAYEDGFGYFVEMEFHSTPQAQNARTIIKERLERGKFVGLSIGYMVKQAERGEREGKSVRLLKDIEVFEIGFVTMPANDLAEVTFAKAASGRTREEQFKTLSGECEDYLGRIAELAQERGDDWKAARVQELDALASQIAEAKAKLSTDEPEAKNTLSDEEREQILAKAQELLKVNV